MPTATVIPGYTGRPFPRSVTSLVDILKGHGFTAVATTQYAGKTVNLMRDGGRCGYINPTVLGYGAVIGYNFGAWDHPYNACPPALVAQLLDAFCQRYQCSDSDIVIHQGTGANSKNTFLLIRSPSLALRILLQDVGAAVDEDIVIATQSGNFVEGAVRDVVMRLHERSAAAREACISHYGYSCFICKARLRERYKGLTMDLIQVHHETPISSKSVASDVDPVADLKPVCPNCHAVVHSRTPPYTVAEVQAMYESET